MVCVHIERAMGATSGTRAIGSLPLVTISYCTTVGYMNIIKPRLHWSGIMLSAARLSSIMRRFGLHWGGCKHTKHFNALGTAVRHVVLQKIVHCCLASKKMVVCKRKQLLLLLLLHRRMRHLKHSRKQRKYWVHPILSML